MIELYRLWFTNGKSYIGISHKGAKRYKGHEKAAKNGSDLMLSRAWRKYGAPRLEVLAVLEDEDAPLAEQKAISTFGTLSPKGYNMTFGGETSPMLIPEIAEKAAAKLRGRKLEPHSEERRKAESDGMKRTYAQRRAETGSSFSTEQLQARSARLRGKPAWNKGQKGVVKSNMTPEQKSARSDKVWVTRRANGNVNWAGRGKPGRKWTPEQRQAKSIEVRAWQSLPENKQKNSDRAKAYFAKHPPGPKSEQAKELESKSLCRVWSSYTPEQRAERIHATAEAQAFGRWKRDWTNMAVSCSVQVRSN